MISRLARIECAHKDKSKLTKSFLLPPHQTSKFSTTTSISTAPATTMIITSEATTTSTLRTTTTLWSGKTTLTQITVTAVSFSYKLRTSAFHLLMTFPFLSLFSLLRRRRKPDTRSPRRLLVRRRCILLLRSLCGLRRLRLRLVVLRGVGRWCDGRVLHRVRI